MALLVCTLTVASIKDRVDLWDMRGIERGILTGLNRPTPHDKASTSQMHSCK